MSDNNQPPLFLSKRFLPLFLTQFLGALNDNLFRQAIVIMITFRLAAEMGMPPAILTNLAIGFFILPYFLFSALAGQLADKFEKSNQILWIKIWEIGLMIVGGFAFYLDSLPMMIAVLSGLGLQSTFFGPIKYGILPDLIPDKQLLSANAAIEAGTFIAILLGIIIGGLFIEQAGGTTFMTGLMILVAIAGTISGAFVPKTGQAAPKLQIQKNIFASTGAQLHSAWRGDVSRRSIIAISWIWLYGSIYISQMPVVVKDHLGGDESVVTLFMVCFSLGIAAGSFLCSRLLKGKISARLAPKALLALMVLGVLLFALLPPEIYGPQQELQGIAGFLANPFNGAIMLLLVLTAVFAGMIIVPMYAILQHETDRGERSRMIAANNIVNSGFMAGGSLLAAALIAFGLTTTDVLLIAGIANLLILPPTRRLQATLAN